MFLFKKQVDNLKTNHRVRRIASRMHGIVEITSMDSGWHQSRLMPLYHLRALGTHLGRLRASGQ